MSEPNIRAPKAAAGTYALYLVGRTGGKLPTIHFEVREGEDPNEVGKAIARENSGVFVRASPVKQPKQR